MKKRYSEEQIVGILRDVSSSDKPVPEACRSAGISVPTYYNWKRKFGERSANYTLPLAAGVGLMVFH
jgi:putative transposase